MTRLVRNLGLLTAGVLLTGCTLISPNTVPQPVTPRSVPFGLLHRFIPGTRNARVRFVTQPIYLIDIGGKLAASSRIVPSPVTLSTVIRQLLLGPSRIEAAVGYHSALPSKLVLVSATMKDGLATINLASSLTSLRVPEQILAEAQLTLTAHDAGATKGLTIEVAGVRQLLILPSGAKRPVVTSGDFASLTP